MRYMTLWTILSICTTIIGLISFVFLIVATPDWDILDYDNRVVFVIGVIQIFVTTGTSYLMWKLSYHPSHLTQSSWLSACLAWMLANAIFILYLMDIEGLKSQPVFLIFTLVLQGLIITVTPLICFTWRMLTREQENQELSSHIQPILPHDRDYRRDHDHNHQHTDNTGRGTTQNASVLSFTEHHEHESNSKSNYNSSGANSRFSVQ